jgi:hypothetical protein
MDSIDEKPRPVKPYCGVPTCPWCHSPKNTKKEWGKCTCIGSLHAPDCGAYANLETQIAPKYEGESATGLTYPILPPSEVLESKDDRGNSGRLVNESECKSESKSGVQVPPSNESEWEEEKVKFFRDWNDGKLYDELQMSQALDSLLTTQRKSDKEKMVELVRGMMIPKEEIEDGSEFATPRDYRKSGHNAALSTLIDHLSKE